jgi:CHAD domain-containing protein
VSAVARAKVAVRLAPSQRADAAAVAVLRALLEVIRGDLEGAQAGEDPEFLHQLRRSVRRSRTVQRQLQGVFPSLLLPGYRSEFRWLQTATAQARDLDVHLGGFEELRDLVPHPFREDLEPLRMILEHWRLAAHAEMVRALLSRRTTELLEDWEMLLETLVERPAEERPDAVRPVVEVAGHRISRLYERLVRGGERVDLESSSDELHSLRKRAKELRYMLEMFGRALFDEAEVVNLIAVLKAVQELLGRHHDRTVQAGTAGSLTDELASLPGGAKTLVATGVLIERLGEDARAVQAQFGETFAPLAAPEQQERVARTFG